MKPRQLKTNAELFDYLVELSSHLKTKGNLPVSEEVRVASRFFSGSPSEFLHEAEQALQRAKHECKDLLTPSELADLENAIEQIDLAFRRVGGA